jgi:hypothetical protein
MPIDVEVEKRKGWFSKERKTVIEDVENNHAIEKIPGRVYRRDGFSMLKKIDENASAKFKQTELPILLEELRIYRKKLDTDELEEPMPHPEDYYKNFPFKIMPNVDISDYEDILYKITNVERDTISRLIEIVEDNVGEPNTSILFIGWG